MVQDAYVDHVPVLTGGSGHGELREFYTRHFIPRMPPDMEMVPVSRTVGSDQLVDEMVIKFTHSIEMDWMLPGIPPTGRWVEVPLVVIVRFRDGKLAHEHIYWDQASVLAQLAYEPAGRGPERRAHWIAGDTTIFAGSWSLCDFRTEVARPPNQEFLPMHERVVPIPTPSGRMETFISHPEQGGPFPAVVMYMDFWGVREELFDIARRVATVGYYCMVPDLYYRQGRVRNEWRNEKNQMISMHLLDAERQRQARIMPPPRI